MASMARIHTLKSILSIYVLFHAFHIMKIECFGRDSTSFSKQNVVVLVDMLSLFFIIDTSGSGWCVCENRSSVHLCRPVKCDVKRIITWVTSFFFSHHLIHFFSHHFAASFLSFFNVRITYTLFCFRLFNTFGSSSNQKLSLFFICSLFWKSTLSLVLNLCSMLNV